MRMGSDGHIITKNYDPNWGPFYFLNRTAPYQLYFLVGYPAVFLTKLSQASNRKSYLDIATQLLKWTSTCDDSLYAFHFAHKVALAASYVASINQDEDMITLAERISTFLVSVQNDDGSFLSSKDFGAADLYDQSAEIALWLRIIDGNLYSAVNSQ